ncbi:LOW QUALITY PROTEIN: GTPase-activating protein-like [Ctenocephalides felis]|uniref:LOW QUALITY PROTEIN: GTPase-activating protein-like n=1 Tax=Ctenocephalides felis TaxID=7515 RepID=UPI000E6E34A2|nr:LOW QUALITY PROTEIN: GTPase-activating protein-like [Ctenocephalides felis]
MPSAPYIESIFREEFQFEIPRTFRHLCVYVFDRDRHLRQDRPVGKVAIRREELQSYDRRDHWFALRPVDADSEVQGAARVLLDMAPPVPGAPTRVTVRVAECAELALKNGACDPYAIVTARYTNGRKIVRKTKVRRKTESPTFDETFTFDLRIETGERDREGNHVCPAGEADLLELSVGLWHDSPGMVSGSGSFLGEIRIPLKGHQQREATARDAWYRLQPRRTSTNQQSGFTDSRRTPPGTRLSSSEGSSGLGSLRLRLDYTEDRVFPEQTYNAWRDLLLESTQIQPVTSSAVYLLGEIIKDKEHAAKPLVRLFTHHHKIVDIIKVLADYEILKLTDATTIFRGNTLVSKMMDEAMRLWGLPYLHRTLKTIVETIFAERKPCEIDPMRVKDVSAIQGNLDNLKEYVEKVFSAISDSAVHCPGALCEIFSHLRESAARRFPQDKQVRYSVVSGFIFLRFFAPAILGPRLFDLTTEQMDDQTNRTLTLISKTIQSLGNLVSSRSAQQPAKEQYMCSLYKAMCTERHVESVKRFLELVSASSSSHEEESDAKTTSDQQNIADNVRIIDKSATPYGPRDTSFNDEVILLKEGMMTKRAQGRRRFGWRNFRERYFRLTTQSLSYAKAKGKTALCTIPLANILAVEELAERSFKMKNMFQIVQAERVLYVQTANCVELKEWVDILHKVCNTNRNRLNVYHPCAFLNGQWQCCQSTVSNAPGCTAVSVSSGTSELHMTLDPAWDLQRLHSLFVKNLTAWEMLVRACECQTVAGNDCSLVSPVTEDPQSCLFTLMKLRDIAKNLDLNHTKLLGFEASQMKYGSRQAPIGDDNYFHLAARSKKDISGFFASHHELLNTSNLENILPTDNNAGRHNSFAMKSSRQEMFKTIAVSLQQSVVDESNGLHDEKLLINKKTSDNESHLKKIPTRDSNQVNDLICESDVR